MYNFPQIGSRWTSDIFYGLLSALIKLVENFYIALDTILSPFFTGT